MRTQGFTLIELAVVLAIISVLAAVLTPVVIGYVDQARVVRATADVKTLADAVRLFQRDTGRWPIYTSLSSANSDTAAADMLIGTGSSATLGSTWSSLTTTADLFTHLNTNTLGISTGAQVGNAIGRVAYRGPYLGTLETDPWGNRYIVTAKNLKTSGATSSYWAFVISAGQNGTMDTSPTQANTTAFAVSGDDVVALIK